jgi:acyl-coenzyme A thioesterase PaaI-like protein
MRPQPLSVSGLLAKVVHPKPHSALEVEYANLTAYGDQMSDEIEPPASPVLPGGDFDPPVATGKGGPDYGRFLDTLRDVQDHARASAPPDHVVTEAADLLRQITELLAPFAADEWTSPSGRRPDLPMRGNILSIPHQIAVSADGRVRGWARFRRYHLGRNGAVHGGAIAHLFDSVLGQTAYLLTEGSYKRTAYLHVNYRKIVPIERELRIDAGVTGIEGRKFFVQIRLFDDDTVLSEGDALFVQLKPGQP